MSRTIEFLVFYYDIEYYDIFTMVWLFYIQYEQTIAEWGPGTWHRKGKTVDLEYQNECRISKWMFILIFNWRGFGDGIWLMFFPCCLTKAKYCHFKLRLFRCTGVYFTLRSTAKQFKFNDIIPTSRRTHYQLRADPQNTHKLTFSCKVSFGHLMGGGSCMLTLQKN